MNASWEDIGIRDGANGRPEEYLIQHSTACAKVGVSPDRGAYLHGREPVSYTHLTLPTILRV